MPAKDLIETAAYRLPVDADIPAILGTFHAFHVPPEWPELLRRVWQREWTNPNYDLKLNVGHVNAALRTMAPDVLDANGWKLDPSEADNWLYARRPVDPGLLKRVMQAYLQESLDSPQNYPELRDAVNGLDVAAHAHDWQQVDATQFKIIDGPGGAASIPAPLFRLIPEVVAEHIARLDKYDGELRFIQVPSKEGAELMSWPPSTFVENQRKGDSRTWSYSAKINVTLRTTPFDPMPRLHLSAGIRRWVPGKVSIPRKTVTAYLLPPSDPTANDGQPRFAVASLIRGEGEHKYAWRGNGPAQILGRLSAMSRFPDPERLGVDASTYLPPTSGFEAAVIHHTQMYPHGVETGLLPEERRRLLTWAATAIPAGFEPALTLKQTRSFASPVALYQARKPKPKAPDPPKEPTELTFEAAEVYKAELADYAAMHADWQVKTAERGDKNLEIEAENARRRRAMLKRGMGDRELRVDVLTDTNRIRDALTTAASTWLGLTPETVDGHDGHVVFRSDEVIVRLIHHTAGKLTSPLGGARAPAVGDAFDAAVNKRASVVQQFFDQQELVSELALVEIAEPKKFRYGKQRSDPYNAIRQGAARAKRVTQFITTGGKDKHLPHRAEEAWADGIRSLGISLVPPHSKDLGIPETPDQIAFWVARRNTSRSVTKPVYMPIAVLVRPEAPRVLARTPETIASSPGTNGWLPYNLVLCELACAPPRSKEMRSAERQGEELMNFVRLTLQSQRGRPTLLLVEASNVRYRWPWFKDVELVADRFSTGVPMNLATVDKQLRVVRVRSDAGRDETPMWWALDTNKPSDPAGYSKGLWQATDAGDENRVFWSTAEKNGNLNSLPMGIRKLTRRGTEAPSPNKAAPGPKLLEITVAGLAPADGGPQNAAVDWAAFVHQQRFTPDFPTGLGLPYVLKLCSKAGEFAFPEDRDEDVEDETVARGRNEDDE